MQLSQLRPPDPYAADFLQQLIISQITSQLVMLKTSLQTTL
jgi:hypothetical protein